MPATPSGVKHEPGGADPVPSKNWNVMNSEVEREV